MKFAYLERVIFYLVFLDHFLQLLSAHQQEIDQLEERLRADHERQKSLLRRKMAEKRRRKQDEVRRSHEVGRQRELIEQKQEIDAARDKAVSCFYKYRDKKKL